MKALGPPERLERGRSSQASTSLKNEIQALASPVETIPASLACQSK